MDPKHAEHRYAASPEVPGEARRFVDDVLTSAGQDDETREAADLLTSEVVTDALRHGPTNVGLTVDVADGVVRVEVEEDLGWVPDADNAKLERSFGRRLVDVISRRWGSDADRNRTSTWFEVDGS
jgi:anti-sigma regulatory factor (Ser/Thr protein kinase)